MKPELISVFDIVIGCSWLILFLAFFWVLRLRNLNKPHYRLFYPAMLFKLGFGLVFALTYTLVLGGGDTTAYWDGAVTLNHLFWDNPMAYFKELLQTPSLDTIHNYFNPNTGYPPSWIYQEPESFFVSKIVSVFTFLTFNSYLGMTVICSGIAGICSWKMYELVKDFKFCKHWVLAVATLFIPTVAFWCSGVSKDTFVLAAFETIVYIAFVLLLKKKNLNFKYVILLLVSVFFLYRMRDFMLAAIVLPLAIVLIYRFIQSIKDKLALLWFTRLASIFVITSFSLFYLQSITNQITENPYLNKMAVLQQDFAQNKLYTGPRYDLNISDYSAVGAIKAMPKSVFTAFYRPFIWEASSAFLLVSALEGILLMALTFGFFFRSGNLLYHFRFIRSQEFLIFALLFSLILGFFAGFTSGLFNVLVRFKAPFMPLIIIFFAARRPQRLAQKD